MLVGTLFFVSSAEMSYCCEKLVEDNALCKPASEISECVQTVTCGDPSNPHECKVTPTSCESTSYCKTGTCMNTQAGECSPNSPLAECEANGGTWDAAEMKDLPQCQLGCCILGDQTSFVTQIKCTDLSSEYGLETNYHPEIDNFGECQDLANPNVEGACVFDEGSKRTCKRLTKSECQEFEGTSGATNVEFNEGLLCSNEDLATDCGPSKQTTCYEDRVHFIDTCGNLANVYDYNEITETVYWNKIIEPEDSCSIEEDGEEKCGNCDYFETSSICKTEKLGGGRQAIEGDYVCADLSCKMDLNGDGDFTDVGEKREHGESWCGTNAVEGEEDSPGARYFVNRCYESEVTTEPCSEFRQEVCYESDETGKTNAQCVENLWKDCAEQETEDDCINSDVRDCVWTSVDWYNPSDYEFFDEVIMSHTTVTNFGLDEFVSTDPSDFLGEGYCSPKNTTGLHLKEIEDEEIEVCMNNSYSCEISWVELREILDSMQSESGRDRFLEAGFECVDKDGNIRDEWLEEMNDKCVLSGDCGKSKNFLGNFGHKNDLMNFVERSDEDVGDWYIETADTSWISAWRMLTPFTQSGFSNIIYLRKITETVTFNCEPWTPPRGGENCEECNLQDIPCTEYQCSSLGQGCATITDENGNLFCYHDNKNEPNPPVISLIDELPEGFEWSDKTATSITENGVKLIHPDANPTNVEAGDNCIPAYTPFDIKIHTDELANCRYDTKRISASEHPSPEFFELMEKKFNHHSGNMYNHTASFVLPDPNYIEDAYNITIDPAEEYEIYVRCMDGNGNANAAEFEIKFCIDDGPDTTPPWIEEATIDNGAFIGYEQTEVDVTFTGTEFVDCKWDRTDLTFNQMANNMTCNGYYCDATLTGLISNSVTPNKYFIRCRDQPHLALYPERASERNTMQTSYVYTLYGSLPLGIRSAGPNNTKLSGPTDVIQFNLSVETFGGAEEGKATCYAEGVEFVNTGAVYHTQSWTADAEGSPHTVEIKCIDAGGNTATEEITFEVEEDKQEPMIVRAFKDSGYLRLITNEPAQCAYSVVDCNFAFTDEGIINITAFNTNEHLLVWNTDNNFYVRCKDKYDNPPDVGTCSIVVRASDLFGED